MSILSDFPHFCDDDSMITSKVPHQIGIGVARGSACRLTSGDQTLDYCGRILNLAARLMDVARPAGLVIDAEFGVKLLPRGRRREFAGDRVYLRGVAQSVPRPIFYTKSIGTRIPVTAKKPISKVSWKKVEEEYTLQKIKEIDGPMMFELRSEPRSKKEIVVQAITPTTPEYKRKDQIFTFHPLDFGYRVQAGTPTVELDFRHLARHLEKEEVKDSWPVAIEISYQEP